MEVWFLYEDWKWWPRDKFHEFEQPERRMRKIQTTGKGVENGAGGLAPAEGQQRSVDSFISRCVEVFELDQTNPRKLTCAAVQHRFKYSPVTAKAQETTQTSRFMRLLT